MTGATAAHVFAVLYGLVVIFFGKQCSPNSIPCIYWLTLEGAASSLWGVWQCHLPNTWRHILEGLAVALELSRLRLGRGAQLWGSRLLHEVSLLLGTSVGIPLSMRAWFGTTESCYHHGTPCDPACSRDLKWPLDTSNFIPCLSNPWHAVDYSSNCSRWCRVTPPSFFQAVCFVCWLWVCMQQGAFRSCKDLLWIKKLLYA